MWRKSVQSVEFSEGNISYSLSCKFSGLYELAFSSQLHLCLPNSYSETQHKAKHKQKPNKEVFCLVFYILFCFFIASLMASFSIAVPLPQQLSMKLTISLLLKNTIDLLFFSEHKLYGFPQSDLCVAFFVVP